MDHQNEVYDLLAQAAEQPHGPQRIDLTSRAVDLADSHNDDDLAMDTRMELVQAAIFGGSDEVALAAFAWCLSQYDRGGRDYLQFDIMWRYKWIVGSLPTFPGVARKRILDMVADLGSRLRKCRCTRPHHQHRTMVAVGLGDLVEAAKTFPMWQKARRDWLSDCEACDADAAVDVLVALGRDREALEKARPILAGRLRCEEVPARTFAGLLLPLMRLGDWERAQDCHRRGYRLVSRNPNYVRHQGLHLGYLALAGALTRGLQLLARHLPAAMKTSDKLAQFDFLLGALLLAQQLQAAGKTKVRLTLPRDLPIATEGSTCSVSELEGFLRASAERLAAAFDTRNGNDYYARRFAEMRDCRKTIAPPSRVKG